ncbi:MAG TPA: SRPBCC family protein [Longimicrobium sp.]|nr:SRPBCC family protein [Longimicrobium sp.]
MVTIEMETVIAAPVERVFDLARSIDLHTRSTGNSGERAIAGRTSGLIGLDETVTWSARHLGVRQRHTSRISAYDRPRHFADVMVRGTFAWMEHDHWFDALPGGGTRLRDSMRFAAPLGVLGRIAEAVLLRRYMTAFLRERNAVLKRVAESDEWRRYLPGE